MGRGTSREFFAGEAAREEAIEDATIAVAIAEMAAASEVL
jgi:hypothetical protein